MTWNFSSADISLVARLVAFVVLAHDRSVPATWPDYWEISRPHYLTVMRGLTEAAAGHQAAADLSKLAASPADPALEQALAGSLSRLLEQVPAERARLARLVGAAREHILIDYHRGSRSGQATRAVGLKEVLTWQLPRPRAERPGVGVVIPFRDKTGGARARNLLACLAALRDQRHRGGDATVTVVECDSEPRWRETVANWVDHYVFAPHAGHFNKSWTVNVGVRQSSSDAGLICVLDADVLVDAGYLARNLERAERRPDLGAWLPYRTMFCLDEASSDAAIRSRCEMGSPEVSPAEVRALVMREPPGACMWVRTDFYHEIGGFDERYEGWGGEDDDIVARLARAGRIGRFDDPLLHLWHPRPQVSRDGKPFNAHIPPMSWDSSRGYGDLSGPVTVTG